MLDLRRLRLLRDLQIYGTVTATAEARHLSGPAVSQQLAALEREAGLPLLEKQGRRLRLTPAGSLLAEHAEVILGQIATVEADLRALQEGGQGLVRLAVFASAARVLMPRLWHRMSADHAPTPELRITECEPDPAAEALRRREVDIAIVHAYSLLPRELPPGCRQHHLMDEPVLLAMPTALASRRGLSHGQSVHLADFAHEHWLMPGTETSCHEMTRRACGAAGFVPRPIVTANDFSVLSALVAAEAGMALIPRMALPSDAEGISLHPLAERVDRTVSAYTRTGDARLPRVALVLEAIRSAAADVTDAADDRAEARCVASALDNVDAAPSMGAAFQQGRERHE
ncbi:LysR family transcriptional regulator [Nonomuraea sp. NPDC050383]|uniref:LysR family transcriptional regulator n=1 Tax=Nonomuraea sp. NPDC050383 TaxID=3364362 RepID=UPI0037B0EB5A